MCHLQESRRCRWARLVSGVAGASLVALLFFQLAAGVARAETVAGTFRYRDGADGTLRPIAHAKVEIHRYAPRGFFRIWSWANDRVASTDAQGRLNERFSFVDRGVVYGVKIFATNYAAVVWPNDAIHTVPFHREPGEPGRIINHRAGSPNALLDFSFDFADNWAPQHYNIAEVARLGFDYANARRDPRETDPIGVANFQPTSAFFDSWYNPVANSINVHSRDVFEDFTILHEYAHYLEAKISNFAWIPAHHNGCTAKDVVTGAIINSAEHAWMEGFADYFAQAVAHSLRPERPLAESPYQGTPTAFTLETPPLACSDLPAWVTRDQIENSVAGVLWDLFDAPGDPSYLPGEYFDRLGRQDVAIFQIFDREMGYGDRWPTLHDFRGAWNQRGLDRGALDQLFTFFGIPLR